MPLLSNVRFSVLFAVLRAASDIYIKEHKTDAEYRESKGYHIQIADKQAENGFKNRHGADPKALDSAHYRADISEQHKKAHGSYNCK